MGAKAGQQRIYLGEFASHRRCAGTCFFVEQSPAKGYKLVGYPMDAARGFLALRDKWHPKSHYHNVTCLNYSAVNNDELITNNWDGERVLCNERSSIWIRRQPQSLELGLNYFNFNTGNLRPAGYFLSVLIIHNVD